MHIVVCIKQVPDTTQVKIDPVTNTLMRQGVPSIINPYDTFALEEAFKLKDKFGASVTVITMGPPQADAALRKAVSYGADRAILLTDRSFAGADTLATSYAISEGIRRVSEGTPFDIIICGKQTIDGDTAQVGPGIACRLNLPQLTYVSSIDKVDLKAKEIVIKRRAEGGLQVLKSKLPCLLTVLEGINELRFPPLPNLIKGARCKIEVWDCTKLNADTLKCGLKGSPTMVNKVFAPPQREKGEMVNGVSDEAKVQALIDKLMTLEVLSGAEA